MTCKGRLVVNFHTNKIVGMAEDALKTDVVLSELKELQTVDKVESDIEKV